MLREGVAVALLAGAGGTNPAELEGAMNGLLMRGADLLPGLDVSQAGAAVVDL